MAIQIPTLKRIQPQEPESVGRVKTNTPDFVTPMSKQANALENLGEGVAKYIVEAEDNEIELEATRAGVEFEQTSLVGIARAKTVKGDPRETYAKLDEELVEVERTILEKYSKGSNYAKSKIKANLDRVKALRRNDRVISEALQYQQYENETTEAAINLRQESIASSISTIQPGDMESLIPLQAELNAIRDLRIESGKRTGLIKTDQDIADSPIIRDQIQQDLGKAVKNVITTLNSSGLTGQSEMVMKTYGHYLSVKDRSELNKRTADEVIDNQALVAFNKVKYIDDEVKRFQALESIKDDNVRKKAQAFLHDYSYKLEAAEKRRASDVHAKLDNIAETKGLVSFSELESTPEYKELSQHLEPEQRKALKARFNVPKESDPDHLAEAFDVMFSGQLTGMSITDVRVMTRELSKKDRGIVEGAWRAYNDPNSQVKKDIISRAGANLKREMTRLGVIKHTEGSKKKDRIAEAEYYSEMMIALETNPPGPTVTDQYKWVSSFVSDKIAGRDFVPPTVSKFKSRPKPAKSAEAAPAPSSGAPDFSTLTRAQKQIWVEKFKEQTKQTPKSATELKRFYDSAGGKL